MRWCRRFALLRNPRFLVRLCSSLPTAYPDGHTETSEGEDQQIKYLKEKVDAGADFIVTQLFYDVDGFLQWQRNVQDAGEQDPSDTRLVNHDTPGVTVPIIPGIMPLQSYASFVRLTKLCGTRIPSRLTDALNTIKVRIFAKISIRSLRADSSQARRSTSERSRSGRCCVYDPTSPPIGGTWVSFLYPQS